MRSSFRRFSVFAVLLVPFALTACESAQRVIGNNKSAPDEFAVYERPPLSLPPEFALRPPIPGSVRTGGITPTDEARAALLRRQASVRQETPVDPNLSDGLNAIMRDTGALTADSSIRDVVDSETSLLAREDQRLADKMIFWVDDKPFEGTVIDAQKEQQRIRENQALGRPLTEGETVQVRRQRERKGLLEF